MEQAKSFVCRSCATNIPNGQKFCGRCGSPVLSELLALRTISPTAISDSGKFTVPPAPSSRAEIAFSVIGGERGVIGVVTRDKGGEVAFAGAVDARLEERAAHLARLAVLVGEELGLESLRELHVGGTHNRIAWLIDGDGSSSCVLARADADMVTITKKVRR